MFAKPKVKVRMRRKSGRGTVHSAEKAATKKRERELEKRTINVLRLMLFYP